MAVSLIRVGFHPSLDHSGTEVKYVFRTLLRAAGFAHEFSWAEGPSAPLDIYYGPQTAASAATVTIAACGRRFADAPQHSPTALLEQDGLSFLDFGDGGSRGLHRDPVGALRFSSDIVFASYWLLTGASEPQYRRDARDNLSLEGSFFLNNNLQLKPLVSLYAAFLRRHLQQQGREPLPAPWVSPQASAAFAFSHDVDYPQMIRPIESMRIFASRGFKGLGSIAGVWRGSNHFWRFADWVKYEKGLGTRPAFYFSARKGSLIQYATGTPDCFYDIHAPEFRDLFLYLKDEGCEVGLHASYHAHRSADQLRSERESLEEAAGVPVEGNRHHFWHLDPAAPNETLRRHEGAGLTYDCSLAFEFYPGFRRGTCHPFHPFHPGERRELTVLQLPTAWMDDHFHRRLAVNKISDPDAYARGLVETARKTGGICLVDYHQRGMNADFYPNYGPWLMRFIEQNLASGVAYLTPRDIARRHLEYEALLNACSRDLAVSRERAPAAVSVSAAQPAGSPLMVDFLRPDESSAWDAFVDSHPEACIYHSLAWKKVTEEAFGHRAYYLRALDASGSFAGILPLFLVNGLFGRRLVSVPMRDRGGVVAHDAATVSLLLARAVALTRELDCKYLELRSLNGVGDEVARLHGLRCAHDWVTTRIDLTPGVEKLWKALDRDAVRWAINKARKNGVSTDLDASREGVDLFYDLFVRTRSSMGIPPFPRALFRCIWHHLISKGQANLFLTRKGHDLIGGMINFLSKDTFIPAYAAPQNHWRKDYPNESIFWHTIEWAAKNGFRTYDFGADSSRQTGLLWFKQKWGGVQHPMDYHFALSAAASLPNFDSSSWTHSLARRAWKILPVPLSRPMGAWVTRQLS